MPDRLPTDASQQQARDLARSVEAVRRQTLALSNERIDALELKARDLARYVETTRQQTLLEADRKTEELEQKARDLAGCVDALRTKTRLEAETEIEALGEKARGLARSVEAVRHETRLRSETEIAALGQKARDLAVSVESVREETLLSSDLAISGLKQDARDLAVSVERSRLESLVESDAAIRTLNAELEQRVLERTAQLEAANQELEAFSYSVSHDLRAPLRAIDGFSRIVLEDYAAPLADEAKAYLKLVRDNSRQMGQLIDDLLAFSRLGRLPLAKQTVDVGQMVRLCVAETATDQQGRRLDVVLGDLPPCEADPSLLKQVWLNLLSNALKYTRKREAARIEIGCEARPRPAAGGPGEGHPRTGAEAVYFVVDNGAGFDMRYADKLFGVFQRLHRAAEYDGTGVGLAIVQRIVNRHGGRVWADAQIGRGATFSFTLG